MSFEKTELKLPGCYELIPKIIQDDRGAFVKTLNKTAFEEMGLGSSFEEEYYSVSKKNVIRGMHFQVPPHDHVKLIYCIQGAVLDVLLDLRKSSPTYGQTVAIELSSDKANIIYISKGVAHGFYTLSDSAVMIYKTSTLYHPAADKGVLWNSFDFNWPSMHPILSERDKQHPNFYDFITPFQEV